MSNTKRADSGAAEGARRATEQSPESGPLPGAGRWSAKRKTSVVLELLRGADLESTSRKHRVTAATLSEWRERFLAGGEAMLKSRENDAEDEEVKRLKSVVAGVCVDNELLRENQLLSPARHPEPVRSHPHEGQSSPNCPIRCGEPMPPPLSPERRVR